MEHAGKGVPDQLLGEDFAGWVGDYEGLDAPARRGSVVAEEDVKAFGRFFDGGSGKSSDLEEALRHRGILSGIQRRRRFRLVGSDRGLGVEAGPRTDVTFHIVKSAFGFDDAMPAEGGTGFSKCCHSPGLLAAVGARLKGGHCALVHRKAHSKVKEHCGECEKGAHSSPRPF